MYDHLTSPLLFDIYIVSILHCYKQVKNFYLHHFCELFLEIAIKYKGLLQCDLKTKLIIKLDKECLGNPHKKNSNV